MSTYFSFYKPASNPTGLSGTVGGAISAVELLPRKDTLFCPMSASSLVDTNQYRKLFIKQIYNATMTGVSIQLVNVDQTGQIAFALTTGTNDTSSSPTVAPSGVNFTGNAVYPLYVTGSTVLNSVIPIWLKQTIPANAGDDDFVSFQLRVVGTIV